MPIEAQRKKWAEAADTASALETTTSHLAGGDVEHLRGLWFRRHFSTSATTVQYKSLQIGTASSG